MVFSKDTAKTLETTMHPEPALSHWQLQEDVLRRMISRLCIAASEIHTDLDCTLNKISTAMRQKADTIEIEALLKELSQVITQLDQTGESTPKNAHAQHANADHFFDTWLLGIQEMITHLTVIPSLSPALQEIQHTLEAAKTSYDLIQILQKTATLTNQQQQELQHDKSEAEKILQQITTQLDEIAQYLTQEVTAQNNSSEIHHNFNQRVIMEMEELNTHVQIATDIDILKAQVNVRLNAINQHLQDFRHREEQRVETYRERAEDMRTRVEELERETQALRNSLQQEQKNALTDALTGIHNRYAYDQRIEQEFTRWQRNQQFLSVAIFDIDYFKRINDQYGHAAGDKVIQIVAQFLARNIRAVDFIARHGGEEFSLILVGSTPEEAHSVCSELCRKIAELGFHFKGQPVTITISCGIACFNQQADNPATVLERADQALYKAKNSGRNQCLLE